MQAGAEKQGWMREAVLTGWPVPPSFGIRYLGLRPLSVYWPSNSLPCDRPMLSGIRGEDFRQFIEFLPVAVLLCARDGTVRVANAAAHALLGSDDLIGKPALRHLCNPSDDHQARLGKLLEGEGNLRDCELSVCRGDNATVTVLVDAYRVTISDEPALMIALRGRKTREAALELSAKVIENTPEGVLITDSQLRILSVNPAFSATTGYTPEEVRGQRPSVLASGRHDRAFYQAMWASLCECGQWQGEIWNRRKNGDIYPEWLNINAIQDDAGEVTHYAAIFSDLSTQEHVRKRLHRLAYYDVLTDLPNRELFRDRLGNALARAGRSGSLVGLMFLDLDRFKMVNDSLGHAFGDVLLKRVAERLKGCVRESDTVARLGGDEFTVILTDVGHPDEVAHVANKIVEAFRQPIFVESHELFVSASVGISVFPEDGRELEQLTRNADAAMYRAKEIGRNNYQFYTEEMSVRSSERLILENELRKSIDRRELSLVYQPQIDVRSGRIVGVEALARWKNGRLGPIRPDIFIAAAEDTGFIAELGRWVLDQAIAALREWQQAGFKLKMAVNVSGHQLATGRLFDEVQESLKRHQVAPGSLELELTESVLMENAETTMHLLADLHDMGISLAVDDFGTGYSSLAYLRRFEIDKLKIDKSFVTHIPDDRAGAEIAATIIAMGQKLGLRVVAEGVETTAQLAFLAEQGCDQIQGYLFSPPVSADELSRMLGRDQCLTPVESISD